MNAEEVSLLGHSLLQLAEDMPRTLERTLNQPVTVRDMLSKKQFDCGVNFEFVDALSAKAAQALKADPQASFVFMGHSMSLANAVQYFENACFQAKPWRNKK